MDIKWYESMAYISLIKSFERGYKSRINFSIKILISDGF